MKASKAGLGRALDAPDPKIRFYLFHGQDESGSRALAARLLAGLRAEKTVLSSAAVKADPGLVIGEASAISMFGERRLLWIEQAGDELVGGIEALLNASAVESPLVAITGALRKSSALLKAAEGSSLSIAHASYALEGRDAERLVMELGHAEGLRMSSDIASRIAAEAMYNQAIIAAELVKYALFLGASPAVPREVGGETIDALGADNSDGDAMRVGDFALDGQIDALIDRLQRLAPGATEAIPVVRSLQRRLLQLIPLRARLEAGETLDGVMASMGKALFWKDKPIVQRLVSQWSAARLAQLAERVAGLERRMFLSTAPGGAALGEELIAIARAARR